MGSRGIWEQSFAVEDEELVHTVRQYLLLYLTLDAGSGNYGVEVGTQLVSQLASLCQQLLRNLLHLCALDFAIYKDSLTPLPLSMREGSSYCCSKIIIHISIIIKFTLCYIKEKLRMSSKSP